VEARKGPYHCQCTLALECPLVLLEGVVIEGVEGAPSASSQSTSTSGTSAWNWFGLKLFGRDAGT
jgi:hypothetical protein